MNEAARLDRNALRLATLYPSFADRLKHVISRLEAARYRPRIQDAWRSPEDQLQAFNAGRSELTFGFHNVTSSDGKPEALAVDMLDDDEPLQPGKQYMLQLAAAAESEGLVTGIRFGLPKSLRLAIDVAIRGRMWSAPVKIGWDPCHVEATGITVVQARSGKRPT